MISFMFRPLYNGDLLNKGEFMVAYNVIPLVLLSFKQYSNRNIKKTEKFLPKCVRKIYV
jgi:hypothetical protein